MAKNANNNHQFFSHSRVIVTEIKSDVEKFCFLKRAACGKSSEGRKDKKNEPPDRVDDLSSLLVSHSDVAIGKKKRKKKHFQEITSQLFELPSSTVFAIVSS